MSVLAELFPAEDYRFHLTLRRGEPREFFHPQDATGRVLAERRRWLTEAPERYAALLPEAEPLLTELAEMAADWEGWPRTGDHGLTRLCAVGGALEPDLLFLSADETGVFRLRGGVLVFPTGWALTDKLGQTIEAIHGVVPGLNTALGSPIQQFLGRLKPGLAYLRDNWGLAATPELNLHPSRSIPPPVPPVSLDRLWLRVEHQALLALPRSGGIVFGIRIALHRLDGVARDRIAAAGLRRALATMPDDLAAYKRLEQVRDQLVALI